MNDEIDIRTLIGPLKRQSRLILTIIAVCIALAAIIGLSLTPKYQATSLLYVDTGQTSLLDSDTSFTNASADNTKVTSEVEIVKSDGVILKLIDQMNLIGDKEFGVKLGRISKLLAVVGLQENKLPSGSKALASVIQSVKNAVNVQRRGLTYIISVSATSEDPQKAATLANELSKAYIQSQLISKVSNIEVSLDAVQKQISETETSVVATQQLLDDFIGENFDQIAEANSQTDLADLKLSLDQLREKKLVAELQKSSIQKGLGGGTWVSDLSGLKSEALRALETQRDRLTRQISGENINSIALVDLRTQLASIEEQITDEAENILDGVSQTIADVDGSISDLQSNINSRILNGDIQLPDQIGAQLYRLSQQSKNTNNQYQTLLAKAQELEAEKILQVPDTRVISPAIAPNSAVSPNLKLILAAAGILGAGLAIAIAFIIENYVGGFTNIDQVEAITGVPVATTIRKLSLDNDGSSKSLSDRVVTEPLSIFAENLRKLRTQLQIALQKNGAKEGSQSGGKKEGTVIMVSSAVPGEGKSNTSLALARTLAFSGSKTIIIDCDVRKPSVSYNLGIKSGKGLANLFSGQATSEKLADNVEADHLTNLHAVLGYRNELKDVQFMLGFQPFDEIINIAKQNYDFVILDTPPIGPVADALTLAGFADAVVFVIKWARTSQRSISESLKLVRDMAPDIPVLAVLNQVDEATDSGYYGKYSGYYSDG